MPILPRLLSLWRNLFHKDRMEQEMAEEMDAFLEMLIDAIGKTYEGWKGGDYKMKRDTPLWVAHSGHTSETKIVGVKDSWAVILVTKVMREE